MITLNRITLQHSKTCEREGLRELPTCKLEYRKVNMHFENLEKLKEYKKQLKIDTCLKSIEFSYFDDSKLWCKCNHYTLSIKLQNDEKICSECRYPVFIQKNKPRKL